MIFDRATGLTSLNKICGMTHGDVSVANTLCYYRAEDDLIMGVLNEFDGMMYEGRFIKKDSKFYASSLDAQEEGSSHRSQLRGTDSNDKMSRHEELVVSLD